MTSGDAEGVTRLWHSCRGTQTQTATIQGRVGECCYIPRLKRQAYASTLHQLSKALLLYACLAMLEGQAGWVPDVGRPDMACRAFPVANDNLEYY